MYECKRLVTCHLYCETLPGDQPLTELRFLLASCCMEDASCCVGAARIIEMLAYMYVIFSDSENCAFGLQSALTVAGP